MGYHLQRKFSNHPSFTISGSCVIFGFSIFLSTHYSDHYMKNLAVFALALILVCVLFYAGVNGTLRGHATGPFFIFLGVCSAAGLALDTTKLVKERLRRENSKKFGR